MDIATIEMETTPKRKIVYTAKLMRAGETRGKELGRIYYTTRPRKPPSFKPDSYTQISNLGNPAHRHATEGHLPKEAMRYSSVLCKSTLRAALAEKQNHMDIVLTQEPRFPSSPCSS